MLHLPPLRPSLHHSLPICNQHVSLRLLQQKIESTKTKAISYEIMLLTVSRLRFPVLCIIEVKILYARMKLVIA